MKKNVSLILFIIGVLIIGVPQFRILLNELQTATQLQSYTEVVEVYPEQDLNIYMETLEQINSNPQTESSQAVSEVPIYNDPFIVEVAPVEYEVTKKLFLDGVIGSIYIPKIGEQLPIYNGATNEHLALGAATVAGTSLPVGGEGTHSVISAHRGYARANYFRHIDLLVPGDKILITILKKTLTYEVTGNQVVEADDSSSLGFEKEQDLLTLLTCHPYMINDKRLLVHAKRVPTTAVAPTFASVVTQREVIAEEGQEIVSDEPTSVSEQPTVQEQKSESLTPINRVKSFVAVTFKFNSETILAPVKRNLLLNRGIVLLSMIAIFIAFCLLIRNLFHLRGK